MDNELLQAIPQEAMEAWRNDSITKLLFKTAADQIAFLNASWQQCITEDPLITGINIHKLLGRIQGISEMFDFEIEMQEIE